MKLFTEFVTLLLIEAISGGERSLTHGFFVRFPSARVRLVTHSASKHQQNFPPEDQLFANCISWKVATPTETKSEKYETMKQLSFLILRTMTYILHLVGTFLSPSCEGAIIALNDKTLPKAQRTQGWSFAYQSNKFLHKSWSNSKIQNLLTKL